MNWLRKILGLHIHDKKYLVARQHYPWHCDTSGNFAISDPVYTEIRWHCESCNKLGEDNKKGFWRVELGKTIRYFPLTAEEYAKGKKETDFGNKEWH